MKETMEARALWLLGRILEIQSQGNQSRSDEARIEFADKRKEVEKEYREILAQMDDNSLLRHHHWIVLIRHANHDSATGELMKEFRSRDTK